MYEYIPSIMSFLHLTLNVATQPQPSERFEVVQANGYYTLKTAKVSVQLRVRNEYPKTYFYALNHTTLVCGYGATDPDLHDEFLQIILSSDGSIVIRRDSTVTLPLFFGRSADLISISNDYGVVCSDIPRLELDRNKVLAALQPSMASTGTLWKEIDLIGERQILEVNNGLVEVHKPEPRTWGITSEAPSSSYRDFSQILRARLDTFTNTCLFEQPFAFEISGGLDSATLPLYHARFGEKLAIGLGSIRVPGDFRSSQSHKLDAVAAYTGLEQYDIELDQPEHYPLADIVMSGRARPFYIKQDIYFAPIRSLASQLRDQGAHVIATGHGGDEAFENIVSLENNWQFG
jgi:asparagine synthetase B (glutamine-hydrolysing)